MIGDILRVTVVGFLLGAIVMAIGNRKVAPTAARARWIKLGVFFLIVHVVLVAAALGRAWVLGVLGVILAASAGELARAWRRIQNPRSRLIWPVFVAIAALSLWNAARLPATTFALLFLAAAACDGFSQVVGQWLGRTPLVPSVSPAKTIEGFLGGLCAATSVAAMLHGLVGLSPLQSAAIGSVAAVAGLAGDLAASWVKRRAGIKDYSDALPGQGGFLDRFDSLLGALALAGWCL
jgi:phosphatidate cytidylyltransferase